jgi:hypothetical protein
MNNMMLITSTWKDGKTFKLIPTTADCPYVEAIYDTNMKVLAAIGAVKKDIFHMMPKLDLNGDAEMRKSPGRDGSPIKQERRTIETFQEYYLEERADIEAFIKHFAGNADTYDFKTYLDMVPVEEPMPNFPSELNIVK